MKPCTVCGVEKPPEAFHQLSPGKRHPSCKECRNAAAKARYAANRDRLREWQRAYNGAHRAEMAAYRDRNRGRLREYGRERDRRRAPERNPKRREEMRAWWASLSTEERKAFNEQRMARLRERYREWSEERKQAQLERQRAWRRANPEKVLDKQQRRWARERGAPIVEPVDRRAIVARDQSTCYLCGMALRPGQICLDHVMPLARGGAHCSDNLRVICRSCNSRKRTMTLEEFFGRYPDYPEGIESP